MITTKNANVGHSLTDINSDDQDIMDSGSQNLHTEVLEPEGLETDGRLYDGEETVVFVTGNKGRKRKYLQPIQTLHLLCYCTLMRISALKFISTEQARNEFQDLTEYQQRSWMLTYFHTHMNKSGGCVKICLLVGASEVCAKAWMLVYGIGRTTFYKIRKQAIDPENEPERFPLHTIIFNDHRVTHTDETTNSGEEGDDDDSDKEEEIKPIHIGRLFKRKPPQQLEFGAMVATALQRYPSEWPHIGKVLYYGKQSGGIVVQWNIFICMHSVY
ncbi:uncharacterized protein LOC117103004 [Anneissia japonica]|uniref:uncharacterized protein LOC117103004 n=1 Tax=Anneissia japonica TaxID=1529436 RepID=UPI00142585CE|nr:uncharacterized protein LOC117103004 [Anneissia japonica]